MSDEKPPIQPTEGQCERAEKKLGVAAWIALPCELMDDCEATRQLSDKAFRAAVRLLHWQWRFGAIPSDPKAAARNVGMSTAVVREAMMLFSDTAGVQRRQPTLALERLNSIKRFALHIAKGDAGGRPPITPAITSGSTPTITPTEPHYATNNVVGEPEPPEGVEERGRALERAARQAVESGLVVTPLVFGEKRPPAGKLQVWCKTLDDLEKYWPTGPTNLGYSPGQSGFVEVDVDNAAGEAVAGSLGCFSEPTYTVQTPRALAPEGHSKKFAPAVRLRFVMPPGLSFGKCVLDDSLEVFGDTNYVLLPPSWVTEYGAGYAVLDESPALPCPPLLETALRAVSPSRSRRGVRSGTRHATALLEALERVTGARISHHRRGTFATRCPAHDDRTPSLSVSIGDDGAPIFHCHGGCTPAAVLAALGLSWQDVYQAAA